MSFVAAPPAAAPAPPVAPDVAGDGWYPSISIAHFRDAIRLGTLVTPGRARDALLAAGLHVADELADWRQGHEAAGVATLADVPGSEIGGERRALILWRRAVYAHAAADLADTQSDIAATEAERDRREIRAAGADELRRNAVHAIRDLLGRGRGHVRLV